MIKIKYQLQSQTRTLKGTRVWLGSTFEADIFFSWKFILLLISKHHILLLSYCYIL